MRDDLAAIFITYRSETKRQEKNQPVDTRTAVLAACVVDWDSTCTSCRTADSTAAETNRSLAQNWTEIIRHILQHERD